MRISDWSSDVCSSDLKRITHRFAAYSMNKRFPLRGSLVMCAVARQARIGHGGKTGDIGNGRRGIYWQPCRVGVARCRLRSEEHTSELQSLMRISYAVFCLNKKQAIN